MSDPSTEPAEAAFSFLGDGLRLAILRALAEREARAGPREDAMAYSDLRRAVGERDSGKFSYHLGKLTGRFVEKTPEGYRLREPGRETVRLLERGVVDGDADLDAAPVAARCPLCDARVRVTYGDHHLFACCSECAGLFGADECPEGTVTGIVLPPAVVEDLDPTPLFERAHRVFERRLRPMFEGVCLECGGEVDGRLRRCPDHDPGPSGICPECETASPLLAELVCETCGRGRVSHPLFGNPGADDVDATGDGTWTGPAVAGDAGGTAAAWDRFGSFLAWTPTAREDGAVAFDPPSGDGQVVVSPDLRVIE
ncbi:ArsR/SmtB family transcription factor [Halobaculum sp. EA56]|uniref:ArsR/SmtB family transcription factor n=1 Tax=Halobaculum sp. EA56 TaxID=3421648 RepID=UPI003EBE49B4